MMIATIKDRKGLDIPTTLEEYSNMPRNTLSDYVLSGFDTTLCTLQDRNINFTQSVET